MPATLSSLTSEKAALAIPFGDETVNIVYRPRVISRAVLEEIEALTRDDAEALARVDGVIEQFVRVVAEWDVTDDAGEPIPLTNEGLRDVPISVLSDIFGAINADQQPDPTTKNGSRKRS